MLFDAAAAVSGNRVGDLVLDRSDGPPGVGTESFVVAEGAPPYSFGAVAIRTGKAGVDGDLPHFPPEPALEVVAESEIPFAPRPGPSVRHLSNRLTALDDRHGRSLILSTA